MEFKYDIEQINKDLKNGRISMFDEKIDLAIKERTGLFVEIGKAEAENKLNYIYIDTKYQMKELFGTCRNLYNIALQNNIYGREQIQKRFMEFIVYSNVCSSNFKEGYNSIAKKGREI